MALVVSYQVSLNEARIMRLEIIPDGKVLIGFVGIGYTDENGFHTEKGFRFELTGTDFDTIFSDTGSSPFSKLEQAIWQILQAKGLVTPAPEKL